MSVGTDTVARVFPAPGGLFRLRNVDGTIDPDDHVYCGASGELSPLDAFLERAGTGLTAEALAFRLLKRLPPPDALGRDAVAAACRGLVGEPTPMRRRGYAADDYVLTTPMPGAYLLVRLDAHPLGRFGQATRLGLLREHGSQARVNAALSVTAAALASVP